MAESISDKVSVASSSSEPTEEAETASSLLKRSPKVSCTLLPSRCSGQLMLMNHDNFKRSAAPVRLMFFREGSWEDIQAQELESLRSCFLEGKPVAELVIGEDKYAFDFLRMVQVDLVSGNPRSIAWIDEKGKPFFPKLFLDADLLEEMENSRNVKIDIGIRIEENEDGGKRKSERLGVNGKETFKNSVQVGEGSGSKRQRLISTGLKTPKWPNTRLLRRDERKYSLVSSLFFSKMTQFDSEATISAIHEYRASGPHEVARWDAFEKQIKLTRAAGGEPNVVYAWCPATPETVVSILYHGFGLPNKTTGLPAHGARLYLSHVDWPHLSATKSAMDHNGDRHVILCRAILGNVEKVDIRSQQSSPSSADFDTGTDDPYNPKWYVIWSTNMHTHVVPECVVSCKTSLMLGKLKISSRIKPSLTELLSEMNKSIPPSKQQELDALYDTFKAGKMDKEIFIKQAQGITGDDVLVSKLPEFQSSG